MVSNESVQLSNRLAGEMKEDLFEGPVPFAIDEDGILGRREGLSRLAHRVEHRQHGRVVRQLVKHLPERSSHDVRSPDHLHVSLVGQLEHESGTADHGHRDGRLRKGGLETLP